jgi:hypothetical protein
MKQHLNYVYFIKAVACISVATILVTGLINSSLTATEISQAKENQEPPQPLGCGEINAPNPPTNLRTGAGTNFQKTIEPLPNRTFFFVLEKKDGWWRVAWREGSGGIGWISENLVRTIPCP